MAGRRNINRVSIRVRTKDQSAVDASTIHADCGVRRAKQFRLHLISLTTFDHHLARTAESRVFLEVRVCVRSRVSCVSHQTCRN